MKIVFFGLGSIGQKYARLLAAKGGFELLAMRSRLSDSPEFTGRVREIGSWKELEKERPEAAFITNPTALHIDTAIECASRGIALYIEKPLGASVERLAELLEVVERNKVATYVAYVLRFHPVILRMKEILGRAGTILHGQVIGSSYLPDWHPTRDHLKSYSANRELGGGAIWDLSHELDYVEYLFGGVEEISGKFGRRSQVTVDAEDYADLLIETKTAPVNVHINFLSQMNQRTLRVDLEDKAIIGDLLDPRLKIFEHGQIVKEETFTIGPDELFKKQLDYFLANLRNTRMMSNVVEGAKLFKKICEFKEGSYEKVNG